MPVNELIDSPTAIESDKNFMEIIGWWEKKRILYNVILIPIEFIMAIIIWNGTLRWGTNNVLLGSIIFTLCANVLYTMGWGLEFLSRYYIKSLKFKDQTRLLLFIIGSIFSIFTTIIFFYIWLDVQEI